MSDLLTRLRNYQLTTRGRKRPDRKIDGLVIDPEDQWIVDKFYWTVNPWGYAEARVCFVKHKYKRILLHRILLGIDDDRFGDHINRNKLDNRKSNLRIVTKKMNESNVGLKRHNTSGFRGVSYTHKCPNRPWRANAVVDGKQYHIGHFETPEEANKAAREWRLMNMKGAVD